MKEHKKGKSFARRYADGVMNTLKKLSINYVPTDDPGPEPERGGKRLWFLFRTHYQKLMLLSIIFSFTCLPVLTIPASMAGMCHAVTELERKGSSVSFLSDYFHGFKDRFMDRLLLGIATISLPATVWILLRMAEVSQAVCIGVPLAVWLLLSGVQEWFLVLQDTLNVEFRHNLRNGFLLFFVEWKKSLVIMLCVAAVVALIWFTFPFCILILSFMGFGFKQLLISNMVWPVIQDRLIRDEAKPREDDSFSDYELD